MNVQAFLLQDDIACVRIREESVSSEARTPVHFAVVLDNSGSMAMENKLSHVKKSLYYIINMLTADDYVSLITFSDDAKVVSPRMAMTHENKAVLQQRLKGIQSEGSTNISAGLIKARGELIPSGESGSNNHKQGILLLTDGQANYGIQDVDGMNGLIRTLIGEFPGLTISSIGYGVDHNGDLLRGIGSEGGGSYSVVENLENVATVFGDILGGLASCAYQQVTVQIPADATQITQLPGGGGVVRVGDINTQSEVTILLKGCGVGDEIKLQAYDIRGLAFVNRDVRVESSASDELMRHGRVAKLRVDVVNCMNHMRDILLRHGGRAGERDQIVEKINQLKAQVQTEVSLHGESALLSFLLEELQTCHRTMTINIHSAAESRHATQILNQHMTVMTLGRGICSTATPGRPSDPVDAPALAPVFSNGLQRHISGGLRSQTSQVHDENEDPVHPIHSGVTPPLSIPAAPPTGGLSRTASNGAPLRRRTNAHVSWPMGTPSEVSPVGSEDEE